MRNPSLLVLLAAFAAGCATTRVDNEWRDAGFTPPPLAGQRVLVACRAIDETLRRVCEDEWTRQLGAAGVVAVPAYAQPGFPANAGDLSGELRDAGVRARAVTIATSTVQTGAAATGWGYGPQVGVGVGASGGSGGGGFSFGSVGISVPIGGSRPAAPGLGASTSLVDVGSGKLAWSANASAPGHGDQRAQLAELVRVTVEAMRKAGLF
jgi:hypothetical protein